MGRAGRGTSSGGSYGNGAPKSRVVPKRVVKATVKSPAQAKGKGPNQAQVKSIRAKAQAELDGRDPWNISKTRGISASPERKIQNKDSKRFFDSRYFGTAYPKGMPGSKASKGKLGSTSNMEAKEGVKSGQLPKNRFSPTNSARQKPVPTKPSKTGPQTRKLVKKGK
jgi:hypothetical protein